MSSYGIRCTRVNYSCPEKLSPSLKAQQKKTAQGLKEREEQVKQLEAKERSEAKKREDFAIEIRSRLMSEDAEEWKSFKSIVDALDVLYAKSQSWDEVMSSQDHTTFANLKTQFLSHCSLVSLDSQYAYACLYPDV